MNKADFTYKIENGFIIIIDLDLGNMSVTNDIENVLAKIKFNEEKKRKWFGEFNLDNYSIIYKDSNGIYDTVCTKDSKYAGFYSIGLKNEQSAINFVNKEKERYKKLTQ